MSLKFPNARLYIHELLTDGTVQEGEALAQAARDFGLITNDQLCEILASCKDSPCNCIEVGKEILKKHLHHTAKSKNLAAIDPEPVWREVERILSVTEAKCGKCDLRSSQAKCLNLAPAIFDILLQQIARYF
jgi:hypothetical protein